MIKTEINILIAAMNILVNDIKLDDGIANACIAEGASRLEEQNDEIIKLKSSIDESYKVLCEYCKKGYPIEKDGGDEFWHAETENGCHIHHCGASKIRKIMEDK